MTPRQPVLQPRMPTDISGDLSHFDRFATTAASFVSRPWFFVVCALLVLIWAPSILVFGDVDTWQLVINTATTIVTFLLVALLQNTQSRGNDAVQHKLNAIADAVAAPFSRGPRPVADWGSRHDGAN